MDEMSGRSEVKWMWMAGRRTSTRGETRQTEQERIRNRRAGSRRERERERVARRVVDAQPIALAGQPVWHSSAIAFGLVSDYSTLRDRHGVGSDQEPCAKQSGKARRARKKHELASCT